MRAALGYMIALLALLPAAPAAAEAKKALILALGGEPERGFDPTLGWGEYGHPLFQSTLLKRDAALRLVPDLATAWSLSADRLTWTVTIRDDVRFSDGERLTAADVAFTFTQAKAAAGVLDLTDLASARATGPMTVEFKLVAPRVTFIDTFAQLGIVPEHAYGAGYGRNPIGSGPFELVSWSEGQQAIVAPNPHYYGAKPAFARITFLFTAADATLAAVRSGQVDVAAMPNALAGEVPAGMRRVVARTVDNRGLMFPMLPAAGRSTASGDPIGNDVTADPAIRHAIDKVLDRKALAEGVLDGFGRPAYGPADDLPWDNAAAREGDADPEAAREILAAGGWSRQGDALLKDGLRAEIAILYPASDATRQALALAAADMIRPLGIAVDVQGRSWEEIRRAMHSNVVLFGWGNHSPLEVYNLYAGETAGKGYYNAGFYDNPAVTANLARAQEAAGLEESLPYWRAAMWDGGSGFGMKGDAAWAWLVNIDHVYFVSDCLDIGPRQIEPHGHGFPITYNLADWRWVCE